MNFQRVCLASIRLLVNMRKNPLRCTAQCFSGGIFTALSPVSVSPHMCRTEKILCAMGLPTSGSCGTAAGCCFPYCNLKICCSTTESWKIHDSTLWFSRLYYHGVSVRWHSCYIKSNLFTTKTQDGSCISAFSFFFFFHIFIFPSVFVSVSPGVYKRERYKCLSLVFCSFLFPHLHFYQSCSECK